MYLFVCVSLSLRSHILKTTCSDFTKFSVHVNCGRSSASSDDSAICYVLPVLRMTSCFHTMGPCGAWRWQYRRERRAPASSHELPTYSRGVATLFDFVAVYRYDRYRWLLLKFVNYVDYRPKM